MMSPLSSVRFGQTSTIPVRFGEQYNGKTVDNAYAAGSSWGDLVRAVNPKSETGGIIPLMTELRPAQADLLSGINTRLDTLNTTMQQGFAQLTQSLNNRFNAL